MGFRAGILTLIFHLSPLYVASDAMAAAPICLNVRLDQKGGSMEHVPILDQDGVGFCFSYTAAAMVDAYRFSHGDHQYQRRSSPLLLALGTAQWDSDKVSTNFGDVGTAIRVLFGNEFCSQNFIERVLAGQSEREFLNRLQSNFDQYQVYLSSQNRFQKIKEHFYPYQTLATDLACNLGETTTSAKLNEIVQTLKPLLENKYLKGAPAEALEIHRLLVESCPNDRVPKVELPFPIDKPMGSWQDSKEQIAEIYSNAFKRSFSGSNPLPIGLSYCVNKWNGEPKYNGSTKCQGHASVLIGSRPTKAGRCEILLRNSWGKNWCPRNIPPANCEGGQIWVDSEELGRTAFSLAAFQN